MHITSIFTLAFVALAAAGGEYCQQSPYSSILAFAGYGPAKDYCYKSYPCPRQTQTYWTKHTRTWTHTSTPTTTSTTTTTIISTIVSKRSPNERRVAANSANSWAACSSKLKHDGKMGPACSCIETTSTTTTTATSTTDTTTIITAPTTTTTSTTTIITTTTVP